MKGKIWDIVYSDLDHLNIQTYRLIQQKGHKDQQGLEHLIENRISNNRIQKNLKRIKLE